MTGPRPSSRLLKKNSSAGGDGGEGEEIKKSHSSATDQCNQGFPKKQGVGEATTREMRPKDQEQQQTAVKKNAGGEQSHTKRLGVGWPKEVGAGGEEKQGVSWGSSTGRSERNGKKGKKRMDPRSQHRAKRNKGEQSVQMGEEKNKRTTKGFGE